MLSFFRRPDVAVIPPPLEEILDSLGDVVMVIDRDINISYVNACWKKLTGFDPQQSLNTPFSSILHPEDLAMWDATIDQIERTGGSHLLWFRLIHNDSDVRWCEIRIQLLNNEPGSPFSATLCDITPQIRKDEISKASHRSLNRLVDRIPGMIYRGRNDTDWSMEYISEGCAELTGYSREELLNQPQLSIGTLIHPEDAPRVWNTVQLAVQKQQPFELTYRLLHSNGNYRTVFERGQGLLSSTGEVLGIEGIILPIHEIPISEQQNGTDYPF